MTQGITRAVQSFMGQLSRRHALMLFGCSGLSTALVFCPPQKVNAKEDEELQLLNPPGLYDATQNGYSHVAVVPPKLSTVYISGQFGSDENGNVVSPEFAVQLRRAFVNLRIALAAVGARPEDVVKTTVLIVNHSEDKLPLLGAEIQAMWGNRPPANTLIPVPRLALDAMLFEIDAVAVIPKR